MTYDETLDHALRLLFRSRRVLDYMADELNQGRPLNRNDSGIAEDLASEIVALIGHSVTDQPEADEMFALREYLGEQADGFPEKRSAIASLIREHVWSRDHDELPDAPGELADAILALLA